MFSAHIENNQSHVAILQSIVKTGEKGFLRAFEIYISIGLYYEIPSKETEVAEEVGCHPGVAAV